MHYPRLVESDSRISDKDFAALLESGLIANDPSVLVAALGTIARDRGMSRLARETGISRATLYRAFSKDGDPNLSIVLKVATALGIKVKITVATIPRNGHGSGM
ncbi:putative addiction module antidote protein [Pseudomonas brassicacearum]|jgi:probable addiction module antidote protein|uniref:Putative addiction module antidote protein n=1 Tax=Pseudomonas brassicacearum TaxID=930166 RepID=A0A423IG32_9PSED|nr:addiction module antidote protein [Pseudomonas brassicacearum]RON24386.1 putative addiction module antidote protein [Pseudomonas brassicacearum]